MASSTKRSWKLQEFIAHSSNVNCLALGHKSGRVLVTGGDDKKVNLWAVGKKNCIMSLTGHTTPIECVKFDQSEDLVCAGSQTGILKLWDLEQSKLLRTLTGHKLKIKCLDFHPYGEFLTSGSSDKSIKIWDVRKKGCVFTYKGHNDAVNCLKFSPDGQWIASADEEGIVKLWDLRVGRQLKEFTEHKSSVTTVEFHPQEFLLASGSTDRTVNFWDLESFQLVSTTEQNSTSIRCLNFSSRGECLFAGYHDTLKVYCWEPARILDTVPIGWGKISDIAISQDQLIGASSNGSVVVLYVCDLKKIQPFGNSNNTQSTMSFSHGNPTRKSFSKETPRKPKMTVKTIEEGDKSSTDPEDDVTSSDIPVVANYHDIFNPHRSLSRTPPPPEIEAFPEPQDLDPTQPQIIQNLSLSMTNLSTIESYENQDQSTTTTTNLPVFSITKPSAPVRVHPIKPLQKNIITSTSQIKANLSSSSSSSSSSSHNIKNGNKNYAQVPALKQTITPGLTKKSLNNYPLGPQRSNSTLTSRVAPMAAVQPVIGENGKLKIRSQSPDSPKQYLKRQISCRDNDTSNYDNDFPIKINSNIKHSPSDPALNRPTTGQIRNASINKNIINSGALSARNSQLIRKKNNMGNSKIDIRVGPLRTMSGIDGDDKNNFIPMSPDKPIGLDVDDFLTSSFNGLARIGCNQGLPEMSEAEVINSMMRGHDSMMVVLNNRQRSLQIIYSLWHSKDMKSAIESAVAMNDLAIVVDLLGVLNLKPAMWNLDICNSLLRPISELLQSKYEMYVTVGCAGLKLILRNFAPVIKSNVEAPLNSIGVDVSREERYHKCVACYEKLELVRPIIQKKQSTTGTIGAAFRELNLLMNTIV